LPAARLRASDSGTASLHHATSSVARHASHPAAHRRVASIHLFQTPQAANPQPSRVDYCPLNQDLAMARPLVAHTLAAVCSALCLGLFASTAFAQLNDTGQITCYNATAATGTVSPATNDPETAGFDEQDCTRGAAAADALGAQTKIGGSSTPGRDYTKIANNGSVLSASATLGSNPTDWACTRDNITGLIWEVKTDDGGLRDKDNFYTWYNADGNVNGGNAGTAAGANCNATLANCNTTAFRDAVNAASLCGVTDWRLPTAKELQSLVDYGHGAGPSIDQVWFPNTLYYYYWSGQNYAPNASGAWVVYFGNGNLNAYSKGDDNAVRLVRGGQ